MTRAICRPEYRSRTTERVTVTQAAAGKFQGGTDLVFNLKNNGVGVGKINPAVPKSWITLMNSYKAKIIAGTARSMGVDVEG